MAGTRFLQSRLCLPWRSRRPALRCGLPNAPTRQCGDGAVWPGGGEGLGEPQRLPGGPTKLAERRSPRSVADFRFWAGQVQRAVPLPRPQHGRPVRHHRLPPSGAHPGEGPALRHQARRVQVRDRRTSGPSRGSAPRFLGAGFFAGGPGYPRPAAQHRCPLQVLPAGWGVLALGAS